MTQQTKKERIISLLQRKGMLRPRDLDSLGISREYLNRLFKDGILDRPSRGLYTLLDAFPSEHRSIVEACKLVPHGTICLLTALRFHDLTTQSPFEIWMAIDEKARHPKIEFPPLRIARFSGQSLSFGIQQQRVEETTVPVYSPAKTVADCFKYRNKIGLDVAIEALRDCLKQKKATHDEIWQAAKICRMTNVMRPYLESLA